MNETCCKNCKHFKKFREEFEYGICSVEVPFWLYREMQELRIRRPDLNENEGKDCAAYQEKSDGLPDM